ncbi:MAG: pyridoxal phosphate-dependent aminotransferase [Oscillospiraceae bacterium]|nr:pyridoxal phosphate-dependent aminotransferase [Oscillospiraceae bacterium]
MNNRIEQMLPSASMTLMARAKEMQKKDPTVIGLAGGEPDFATPDRVSMAAIRSLVEGDTHYAVGPGLPELRAAICKKLRGDNGIFCDENRILVTPGGKNAIYLAVHAVLNEGDEVIILDPSWVSYEPIVQSAGGNTVRVKLDYRENYRITAEKLEQAYTEKTRMLIINYPNNPTGRILHEDEAKVLENFLLSHPNVYLLSDEVYEALVYDGSRSVSMGSFESIADRVITVNGLSKSCAMTGWRIGYMAANKEVFSIAFKLYGHSLSCMSAFIQKGAVEAFKCEEETGAMLEVYDRRRQMFVGELNTIPGVSGVLPEGAFYAWVFFDINGMSSSEMCEYLMEKAGVVGMPGSAYGEDSVCCMRFSFANATRDLEIAAERIKKALLELQEGN